MKIIGVSLVEMWYIVFEEEVFGYKVFVMYIKNVMRGIMLSFNVR